MECVRERPMSCRRAPASTSLALTVFGSMDVSLIAGQGVGHVHTETFGTEQRLEAFARARTEVEAGRQVYMVFPLVRGEEYLDLKDLARLVDALRTDAFPGARIGVFSGLKSCEERQRVYQDFRHRRIDVLVATTIIEDSPPVPTATAMVVEQADHFDLVRLHRLRAHVAQGVRPGHCMLVMPENPNPEGVRNVDLVCQERDGFRIAELDLAYRGPEALLGNRAKEVPRFRYVDLPEHRHLLVRARNEAFQILAQDPNLTHAGYRALRVALEESWRRWFPGQPALPRVRGTGRGSRSGRQKRRRRRS